MVWYYPAVITAACTYVFLALVRKGLEGFLPPLTADMAASGLVALLAVLAGAEFLRRNKLRYSRDYWLFGVAALAAIAPALFEFAAYVESIFQFPVLARASLNLACGAALVAALFLMSRILFSQEHFNKVVRKIRGY